MINQHLRIFLSLITLLFTYSTIHSQQPGPRNIITADIQNFWVAYDQITSTPDTSLQLKYLDSLYFQKGSPGLHAMRQVRNYTPQEYLHTINTYPKFWSSIRENTMKAKQVGSELEFGIQKFSKLYPLRKPARVYFTVGALRSNGATADSLVLIGSELAFADSNTAASEFPEAERNFRQTFFKSNPIDGLVLLNVHEFVHTQQDPIVRNLLSLVLYEGIAEFVSVKAMGVPSNAPAIEFGKQNYTAVRDQFEREMFYGVNQSNWLWSNLPNRFNVRDLGYYIGYRMAEIYYDRAADKKAAVKKLVELDYRDEKEIEEFVNETGFFSAPLDELYQRFEASRPTVVRLTPFTNNSTDVNPATRQITFEFSEPLNGHNTGIDYGPLGVAHFPQISPANRVWSNGNRSWTIDVNLEPGRHYQFLIDNNFRTASGFPLKPMLVDFKTSSK